ncbi:MAG: methyltransferase [Clostridiaceae bacterium]|nr:methyltransferase [Clostridiaceae bacterium]
MRKGYEYEFIIEHSEFPGLGIAYLDDLKTYIKGAVPGQKVIARVTKKKKDYAEAKTVSVLEDVPYKIEAACPHFGQCGGCTTQFIPYENQLDLKKQQVLKLFKDNLESVVSKEEADVFNKLEIEVSPELYEYRNKMEFTFGNYEKDGELNLGMHVKNKSFSVITVDNCKIIDSDFRKIVTIIVDYFRKEKLPFYKVMKQEGYLRNLVVRKAKNTGEILVNLVTTSQINFDLKPLTEILINTSYDGVFKGFIHTINDSLSDIVQADEVEILYGEDHITEKILGLEFKMSPFSFFQTNSRGAEKLYSIVKDFIGESKSKVVFDLYCGTGTIGQIVAPQAKKVIGIEIIEEAVKAANENAKLNSLTNCEFIAGDVAEVIKNVQQKPDLIILDPPRPGVHPKAMDYVIKFNAPEIVYVSCNPKSLMVDLKSLSEAGYIVEKVVLMDMFPHTPHVETIVLLQQKII